MEPVILLVLLNTIVLNYGFTSNGNWYWLLIVTVPLLLIFIYQLKNNAKQ